MAQKKKKSQPKEVKRFVSINEYNPENARKTKLVWTIVAVFTVALIIFWFWSIKQGLDNKIKEQQNELNVTAGINDAVNEIKDGFGNVRETLKQTNKKLETQIEINNIKNNVLNKIQNNLDNLIWLKQSSENLGIEFEYPANWRIKESEGFITAYNEINTTSTTTTISTIRIIPQDNPDNLSPDEWILKNKPSIASEWTEFTEWITEMKLKNSVAYKNPSTTNSEITIVMIMANKTYDIEWFIKDGEDSDELISEMEKILQSIVSLEN